MPRREIITVDGHKDFGFNVDETVGIGGKNSVGDVMLIQAMMKHLAELRKDPFFAVGVDSMSEVPEPTGKFDRLTRRAIRAFQKKNDYLLLSVDGIIHPADYKNRNVLLVDRVPDTDISLMSITLLHTELQLASDTGVDYTHVILRRFPILAMWLLF
jgi:hypothetical protein